MLEELVVRLLVLILLVTISAVALKKLIPLRFTDTVTVSPLRCSVIFSASFFESLRFRDQ